MRQDSRKVNVNMFEAKKRFVMDKKGIGFFKAILESYEDIAIFSVLDGNTGLIEIVYSNCFEKDIIAIMHDMKNYGIIFEEAVNV